MVLGLGSSMLDVESLSAYTIEILTDAELIKSVENLKKQIRNLRLENEVLEASILRLQPSLLSGVYSALDYALKWAQSQSQRADSRTTIISTRSQSSRIGLYDYSQSFATIKSKSTMLHRKTESSVKGPQSTVRMSKSILGSSGPKINVDEKLELVHAVMAKVGNDLIAFRKFAKKQHDHLNAQLEEIGIRTDNFEKLIVTFEQEVVIEGVDAMTKRIPAETWIRFIMEQGKRTDRQIDKMRIRLSTANVQYRKLKDDIKIKKDLSTRIVPVDFQVKTIEIKLALEEIDRKNSHLIELKALTGDANLNLTQYKYAMMNLTSYLQKVRNLKTLREQQTVKMNAETAVLAEQVVKLEQRLGKIQKHRETYFVPDVLEYVAVKDKISDLNNSINRLKTSLNIKQLALSNFKKKERKSLAFLSSVGFKSAKSLLSTERQVSVYDLSKMLHCTQSDLHDSTNVLGQ